MPLAHILTPQLALKAKEIEDELGHAPTGSGYLEAGYERTPYDPKGLMNKPEAKSYDSRTPVGSYLRAMGTLQSSKDPAQKIVGRQLAESLDLPDRTAKGEVDTLIPNAPVPAPAASPKKMKGGKVVIDLPKMGPVGYSESGQALDAKGKKLGYLNQAAIVTPYGDVAMRTSERRPTDVMREDRDRFAFESMRQRFGTHLKEMRANTDAYGRPTDKFPEGYFKGMSKEKRKSIEDGVKALQAMEREQEKQPMI